jgi:predicted HTH domain antitoxin
MSDVITGTWFLEQLLKLQSTQPALLQRAIQRLLDKDEELRWLVVVNAYLDEQISLGKTASLLGMHPLELRERFIEKGIPLRLGPIDIADAQAEVDAIRAWEGKTKCRE